jgi:pyridoxamine 5'-phosphate oxidase
MPRRPDMPPLRRADLAADPVEQFADWFAEAEREVPLAEAMALATVDSEGAPDARMVLLKGFGPDGFRFFTNYESAKGGQLDAGGRAAILFYWRELDRQVRARGTVQRLPEADSDAYFATRPRDSQLGAWASPQSRPLESREELDSRLGEVTERFGAGEVSRPPNWGGYLLVPAEIEFWQGQVGRLHDRFRYTREDRRENWRIERLGP